jgi:Zn-dependent protease
MRARLSFAILRVWGIPIRLHLSIVLIVPILLLDFDLEHALVYGVGLFVSITLHELGHCFVAIRKGCRVSEILLLPIGGVARMERIPERPRDEALMAIAGPAVSLFLFVVLFFGGGPASHIVALFTGEPVALNIFQQLGATNMVLLMFNLIPAFPMDGGRLLRAWLTRSLGRLRATLAAALLGKAGAVILMFIGCTAEIWTLIAVGVFVFIAAGLEYRAVEGDTFGFDQTETSGPGERHGA